MSRISCVIPDANASTFPLVLGTIAMLEEIDPSCAFSVETRGWPVPSGHSVRELSTPWGTTVALKTYACAKLDVPHPVSTTSAGGLRVPLKGRPLPTLRVSMTLQGCTPYSDSPPRPAGAK